jgi:hypothetical protein
VVTCIESATEHKGIALGAFLDTEGAFDTTSSDIIIQASERHGIESTICKWICAMLESRNMIATLLGETLGTSTAKGCPQRGVLSPLLLSLVADNLLWRLNNNGYYTEGYADDTVILINGKFLQTVSKVLHTALCTVQQWWGKNKFVYQPKQEGNYTLY